MGADGSHLSQRRKHILAQEMAGLNERAERRAVLPRAAGPAGTALGAPPSHARRPPSQAEAAPHSRAPC